MKIRFLCAREIANSRVIHSVERSVDRDHCSSCRSDNDVMQIKCDIREDRKWEYLPFHGTWKKNLYYINDNKLNISRYLPIKITDSSFSLIGHYNLVRAPVEEHIT